MALGIRQPYALLNMLYLAQVDITKNGQLSAEIGVKFPFRLEVSFADSLHK